MSSVGQSGSSPIHLPTVLADLFTISRSEARRAIAQGAVKLNGVVVTDLDVTPSCSVLSVELGRRRHATVDLDAPSRRRGMGNRVMLKHFSIDHKFLVLDNPELWIDVLYRDDAGNLHIQVGGPDA